jgi:hypothetical protein
MVARGYDLVESVAPKPSRFGLLNSETLVDADGDWRGGGISLEPITCNTDVRTVATCDNDVEVVSNEPDGEVQYYVPFTVETKYTCSTFGFNANNYKDKARAALELCQGKAVEHEFWTGELSDLDPSVDEARDNAPNANRRLASLDAIAVAPSGTPLKPRHGLALLEQALADCGCGARGFIHATRGVVSTFADYLEQENDTLVTPLGNVVIAGAGYTGSGPNGNVPSGTQAWMYATGQVSARLGAVEVTPDDLSEATNTRINEVSFVADRFAAVTWDGCCHYAVLVDLSLDYS